MRPVTVDIVAYAPTEFFHCLHCEVIWREGGIGQKIHAEQRTASLPPDLAADYERIGQWATQLADRHRGAVEIRLTDAASFEGLFKTIRYRLGRFPMIIVNGRDRSTATDLDRVTALVDARVEEHAKLDLEGVP